MTEASLPPKQLLRDSVTQALKNYFLQLNGENVNNIYEFVLTEVEPPLLDMVMQYTQGNQTRAASLMGMNRGTLRKKLRKYGLN
ncbi:MAG: DNA-binding transcriptional regulator Fis [Candidatus Symbiodolus clandestinus]